MSTKNPLYDLIEKINQTSGGGSGADLLTEDYNPEKYDEYMTIKYLSPTVGFTQQAIDYILKEVNKTLSDLVNVESKEQSE